MKVPSVECGKQLHVGAGDPKALGTGTDLVRGSAYIEGPLQVGDDEAYDTITATVMIGTEQNTDTKEHPKESLHVKGNVKIEGDTDQTGNITASENITTDAHFVGDITKTSGTPPGCKLFDIQHPTKDGHRLAHACIEGPEVAVYTRGRVCNGKNVIDLPEYWDGLVDYETLTVQLTCLGSHQNVIVKRISPMERKVYLQSQGGMPVDAFYHIMAQRKDVPNLVVEYEGKTPADYPGDNTGYSIAGYNYDVRS